jgi:hypothetical protein
LNVREAVAGNVGAGRVPQKHDLGGGVGRQVLVHVQRDHVVDRPGAVVGLAGVPHELFRGDRAVDLEAPAEVIGGHEPDVMEKCGHVQDLGVELELVVPCQLDGPGIAPDRVVHEERFRDVGDELAGLSRERGIRQGQPEPRERLVRHRASRGRS